MKNIYFLAIVLLASCNTDVVLEEGFKLVTVNAEEIQIEDAFVEKYEPDNYEIRNFGDRVEISTYNGTSGGTPFIVRSFMSFDLDIPSDAIIEEADLSLYAGSSAGFGDGHRNEGDNSAIISRVMGQWEEMDVTWNNQPEITLNGQITLASSSANTQDYLDIDLKELLQDHIDGGSSKFSISLASSVEQPYRSLLFFSSEAEDEAKRPRFSIKYQTKE